MFAEFTISIIAVIVCATAFADKAAYLKAVGNPTGIFTAGLGGAITTLGLPLSYAQALAGSMIIILALTIVNLVFRFMKVASAELLGDPLPIAKNPHIATIVALVITFILVKTGTWLYVWVLFGGANQLMAALALLLTTLFLAQKAKKLQGGHLSHVLHVRHHRLRVVLHGLFQAHSCSHERTKGLRKRLCRGRGCAAHHLRSDPRL
jgi:carbon starvation protein